MNRNYWCTRPDSSQESAGSRDSVARVTPICSANYDTVRSPINSRSNSPGLAGLYILAIFTLLQ